MSKTIQIRNVPDAVHATLKSRAALAGQPLTDYLLAEIQRVAARPTPQGTGGTPAASAPRQPQDVAVHGGAS